VHSRLQAYFRDDYEKPGTVKSLKTCFRTKKVMDRYIRNLVLIYAYTYQKARSPARVCENTSFVCRFCSSGNSLRAAC
jgi:hypothetical protein